MKKDEYIKEHFPEVTPGAVPCGNKVLVQLRTMKSRTSGGIVMVNETKDFNNGNTQLARVITQAASCTVAVGSTLSTWRRDMAWKMVRSVMADSCESFSAERR